MPFSASEPDDNTLGAVFQVPFYAGIRLVVARVSAASYGAVVSVSLRSSDGSPAELDTEADINAA
eukprot:scaffold249550_cov25-Prasinocladus_malaysianus.AAC.1